MAYHFRSNRAGSTVIGICHCGWQGWIFKKTKYKVMLRGIQCIGRGHNWDDWGAIEVGAIYEENGHFKSEIDDPDTDSTVAWMHQCTRCYKCESIDVC